MLLLLSPPVAKGCEPPAGIAYLSGYMIAAGVPCKAVDLNLESQLHLLHQPRTAKSVREKRCLTHLEENLQRIRTKELFTNRDRYKRVVSDLNHLLHTAAAAKGAAISLANYQEQQRNPVNSGDLIRSYQQPEKDVFFPFFSRRLAELLEKFPVTEVGISISYLSQALSGFAIAGHLARIAGEVKILLGGGLVTSWSRIYGKNLPFSDLFHLVIDGPGEAGLLKYYGKKPPEGNPLPDYNDFPCREYFSPGLILPVRASSGCYWNKCSFCPEPAEKSVYHQYPPAEMADQLSLLVKKYNPSLVHLLDNAIPPRLLDKIQESPPGCTWYGFSRIYQDLTRPDYCRELKKAGCVMLKLGVESGSQAVLDRNNKGTRLDQVSQALKAIHEAGISTYVYLLFGTPAETEEHAHSTLSFVKEHAPYISFLNLAIFNMPKNSLETGLYQTEDFSNDDLGLYTSFIHPHGWDRKAVRNFLDKKFRTEQGIRSIILQDPPFFTSNHAPFFNLT